MFARNIKKILEIPWFFLPLKRRTNYFSPPYDIPFHYRSVKMVNCLTNGKGKWEGSNV